MSFKILPKISWIAIAILSTSLTLPLQPSWAKAQSKASSATSVQASTQSDEAAIRVQLSELMKNLKEGNSKGTASLWTVDGEYVDEDGNEAKGRAQVDERFATIFAEDGKPQVNLSVDSVRFLAHDVALIEGLSKAKDDGQPLSRFALLFVKQDGVWRISRASETAVLAQSNYDSLRQVEWLIGDWKAERDGNSLKLKAEWMQDKNFIYCKYEVKKANGTTTTDMQIIGWDPRLEQPVSWSFSEGGFGYGKWFRRGADWNVDSNGVERNGSLTRATNVLSNLSTNGFTWSSVNRAIDGTPVGDTPTLQVQRVVSTASNLEQRSAQ